MKQKIFKKLGLALLMVGLPLTSLTSCGFLTSSSTTTVNTITGVETGLDAYGNIVLTITFSNMDPVVVTIPTGTTGSDGVGIESIYYSPSADGTSTVVTIVYTDPEKDPDTVYIPNGSSLVSTTTTNDVETGISYITLTFEVGDQTMDVTFEIPKGDQGDTGVGISEITYEYSYDTDGNPGVTMKITLTNNDTANIFIPTGSQGEEGVGIAYVVASTVGDQYVVTITYTDESSSTISFDKPADGNSWYTGYDTYPYGTTDGDFFFDLSSTTIYLKRDGGWVTVCTFTTDQTQHTVTFDLNDGSEDSSDASMPSGWDYPYEAKIYHNSYFQTETNKPSEWSEESWGIPIPTWEGYTFKGWCTSAIPSVVSGYLTETTPILSDLNLYAIWEQNEPE